jgi:Flp pilus assembly protein TadG
MKIRGGVMRAFSRVAASKAEREKMLRFKGRSRETSGRATASYRAVFDVFGKDNRGTSAIEFAIVAPVFLLIVLGGLVWGLYLGTSHSVAQLTADAARASVAGLTDTERAQLARDQISSNASQYPLVDPAKLKVVAAPTGSGNRQFKVTVSYDASALPIWFLDELIPLPSKTMERVAVVERGGY